jgi:hypothetical protein
MPKMNLKFTFGQWLIFVVVLSTSMAAVPKPFASSFILLLVFLAAVTTVVAFCTSWSWMAIAAWISSFYPIAFLIALYTTWLTAWFRLGRRPRVYASERISYGPLVDALGEFTSLLLAGYFPALALCVILVLANLYRTTPRKRYRSADTLALLASAPLLWMISTLLCGLDPALVLNWFFD